MRKIYTAIALAAICAPAFSSFAEEATSERRPLIRIQAKTSSGRHDISYNEDKQVIRETSYGEDGYQIAYAYDDKGNQIRRDFFQDLDNDGIYSISNYIEYTYNDKNQMIERRNYNYWPDDDDYEMGAVSIYTYNANGDIEKMNSFYDEEQRDPAERVLYTYNDKNQLIQKVKYISNMVGWVKSMDEQYRYDDKGRLQEIAYIGHDAVKNIDIVMNYRVFKYDNEGNLIEDGVMGANHSTYESNNIYHFLDIPASEVAYPITVENNNTNFVYETIKLAIDYAEVFRQNLDTGELIHYDDVIYSYVGTPVTGITLDPTSKELEQEDAFQINGTIIPANASDNSIIWSSADSKIARVDEKGYVVAGAVGTTEIKATAGDGSGVEAVCEVTVIPRASVESIGNENIAIATFAQTIIVSGLEAGENYSIVAIDGTVVASGIADGNEVRVNGLGTGVYVVNVAGKSIKTIVK